MYGISVYLHLFPKVSNLIQFVGKKTSPIHCLGKKKSDNGWLVASHLSNPRGFSKKTTHWMPYFSEQPIATEFFDKAIFLFRKTDPTPTTSRWSVLCVDIVFPKRHFFFQQKPGIVKFTVKNMSKLAFKLLLLLIFKKPLYSKQWSVWKTTTLKKVYFGLRVPGKAESTNLFQMEVLKSSHLLSTILW